MAGLQPDEDAYGQLVRAWQDGLRPAEIAERGDGFIAANRGPSAYFAPVRAWPAPERQAMRWVKGRALDIGCGAGRVALHLQGRGHPVVAVDNSPLAVEVTRERGVMDARVLAIDELGAELGTFDTVLLFGNNFGLLRSRRDAPRLLRRLATLTSAQGRILAASRDVYRTSDPVHLAYHATNRARGRMSGQIRLRIRYQVAATPWFDYLMVSPTEMAELASLGGWQLVRTLGDEPYYVGVMTKT
jgi:SAM-dependent methyltransferase